MLSMYRFLPLVWLGLLLCTASTAQATEAPAPSEGDLASLIEALAEPGDKGAEAVKRLKALASPDPALIEKASGEFEKAPARKWRARSILRYWKTEGDPQTRELHFLLSVGAWELGKDDPDFLKEEKAEARKALEKGDDAVIPVLLSSYEEQDYPRYCVARDLLVKRGDAVVPHVVPILKHKDFLPRLRAVHVLALIGTDRAIEALSASSKDENDYVRKRVLEAWNKAGLPWSAKTEEFLHDPDASIRVVAVRSFENSKGRDKLEEWLDDDSFLVRKASAETLASCGNRGFASLLKRLSKGDAMPGKCEAVRALGLVASPDARNLARNLDDREAWGRRASDAVALLGRLLKDKDWAVRASVAEALGLAGSRSLLRERLAVEEHPFARFRLREALGETNAPPPPDPARFNEKGIVHKEKGLDALAWLPGDEEALDDALKALKLARKDLEFNRNLTRDEYRFPAIQKALDQPLAIADMTREVAVKIHESCSGLPDGRLMDVLHGATGEAIPVPGAATSESPDLSSVRSSLKTSTLPEDMKKALATFFASASWASWLDRALGKLDGDDRKKILSHVTELGWDPELLPAWKKVDRGALVAAARSFTGSVGALARDLSKLPVGKDLDGVLWEADTPWGKVRVAGYGPDVHDTPAFLIVDLGGDDVYRDGASGGARGTLDRNAIAAVVDLGGDDLYLSSEAVAQGAGFLGLGVLIDLKGRDVYRAVVHAQGCGWFGAGLLYDASGDDRYEADRVAQGAGGFGYGALVDGGGDDVYYSRAYSQAFGFTGGVGALAEMGGNDLYYVDGKYLQYETLPHRKLSMCQGVGYGMRPHASGGLGILYEAGGDDVYRGNAYAQGTSYWYAMGILVDREGYDNYSAKIYSQASGIHMGVGVLADLDGHDNYISWGLSQSGSHDLGVSYFLDASGDDIYTCHDASLGGAINHAVAIFLDRSGRDAYFMKNKLAVGAGDQPGRKDWGSIAVFLDLGGREDTYSSQKGGNGRFWADGNFGAGIDR